MNNNYNEKLVIEILSQITYDFSNIWGIMIDCYTLYLIFKYKSTNGWINNKLNYLVYLILKHNKWFFSLESLESD